MKTPTLSKSPSIFRRPATRNRRTSIRQRRAARRVMFSGDFTSWQGALIRSWSVIDHGWPGRIGSPLIPRPRQPLYDPIRGADTFPTAAIKAAWETLKVHGIPLHP